MIRARVRHIDRELIEDWGGLRRKAENIGLVLMWRGITSTSFSSSTQQLNIEYI